MKKIIAMLLSVMIAATIIPVFAEEPMRIAALKGPTAMGMVQMMNEYQDNYQFSISGSVDEINPMLLKKEVDIAALPANLGANLYQKTQGEIIVLCINTLGVLYIVENGDSIHSISDLKGRTIFASGKGATPEYALRHILQGNGIDPDLDVSLNFKSEHTECLTALLSTPGSVALLPQPFVTTAQMNSEGIRMALDLNREWAALGRGELLTGILVGRKSYVEAHPLEVQKLMKRYQESVQYVNQNPKEAAALIEQFGILKANVAQVAIPFCGIVYVEGNNMMEQLSGYLSVLYEQNPASIGGSMPQKDFYFGCNP